MTILEKIENLKQIAAFAPLRFSELALIAEVCTFRVYKPGEKVIPSGLASDYLFIAVKGKFNDNKGAALPPVVGVTSLLLNRSLSSSVEAGSNGVECLLIKRGHFFTVIHECPALSAGFLRLLPQTAALYKSDEQTVSSRNEQPAQQKKESLS